MDLSDFNNLLFTTPNDAKNFMSFMLGYAFKDSINPEKAIRSLFDSFPQKFKEDIDLFEPIFAKFFNKYSVNEDNIGHYNTYIRNNATQVLIINKNPQWNWSKDKTVIEYNTLPSLLKSFESSIREGGAEQVKATGLKFIDSHNQSFERHLLVGPAAKKKAILMCVSRKIFSFLLEVGYQEFKGFCQQYDIDRIVPLDLMYGSNTYYGLASYFRKSYNINLNDMKQFIEDVINNKEKLLVHNKFLNNESITSSGAQYNLRLLFINYIQYNEPAKAALLYDYFREEVLEGLNDIVKSLNYNRTTPYPVYNEIDQQFLQLVENAIDAKKKHSNGNGASSLTLSDDKIKQFCNYYYVIKNYEYLENNIPNKGCIVSTKKLKI